MSIPWHSHYGCITCEAEGGVEYMDSAAFNNRVSGVLLILGRAFHFDRKPGEDEDGKTAIVPVWRVC